MSPITVRLIRSRSDGHMRAASLRSPEDLLINASGRQFARNGVVISLPAQEALLFAAIVGRCGTIASHEDLIEFLYGHRVDGGAGDPSNVIRTRITSLRPIAALLGLKIETVWGQGYRSYPIMFGRQVAA